MKQRFIAKTFSGLEEELCKELITLGAVNCQILKRSVSFEGDFALLYRTNYFCRTALRILWEMGTFSFQNNRQFYEAIFNFEVERYLAAKGTMAVSVTMHDAIFKTPLFAAMLAKDAICDRFRDRFGERPSVNKESPDVQFHLHIFQNQATLFLDSSGDSLHKRGYKVSNHPAPINEVLAAGMIKLSGWQADCDFIDFMCGSGTILIEAAMQALNIPAGFYRQIYGFQQWKNWDQELWDNIINEANIKEDVPINFYGSDISARYLGMARANIKEANLQDFIVLQKCDFIKSTPSRSPSMVMFNPPYNERLTLTDSLQFYKEIGDCLKQHYAGCKACLISADLNSLKQIGLHSSQKITLYNGALECKFVQFDLYHGSKRSSG